jgi:hypothetical protein
MNTTTKLINSKWDAISSAQTTMGNVRNDLFDNVALALSRIEGKLTFLNSDDTLDGKPRVAEGYSQEVAKQVQQEVADTRKALDKVFVQLTDGKNSLFDA